MPLETPTSFPRRHLSILLSIITILSKKSREIRQQLQREGYTILKGEVEHIHNNQLRKINKKYSIDVAYSKVDIPAVARPMVTLPSDPLVEPDGNGGWVLVAGQGKDS